MNRLLLPIIVLVAVLPIARAADDAAPLPDAKAKALRARFEARQRETRTWVAEFTQTLTMPGLRNAVTSDGTFSFRAPGDLRIEFRKPEGELVLILGERLFLRKPGKRVVEKSVTDNAGKPFQALINLMQGRPPENEEQFEPRVVADGGNYVITLTKRSGASGRLPKRITNIVSEAALEIREVLVELPNGGSLRYAFREPSRNRPLDAVRFVVPAE